MSKLAEYGTAAAGIAAVVALFLLAGQNSSLTKSIDLQTKTIELDHRPYLYVDIQPSVTEKLSKRPDGSDYWDRYLGAKLVYKNVGRTPASNIKAELHMYNNGDKVDDAARLEEWYINEYGFFPKPATVFPEQTGQEVGLFVDASEGATEYLITIRVSYTSEDPTKTYWYSADTRYFIANNSMSEVRSLIQENGQVIQRPLRREYGVWLLETHTDHDAVGNREMPPALPNPYQQPSSTPEAIPKKADEAVTSKLTAETASQSTPIGALGPRRSFLSPEALDGITALATAMAVVVALLIAVFSEHLKRFFWHPRLDIQCVCAPPDCLRTQMSFTIEPVNRPTLSLPCYYFRIRVGNRGLASAENVEVIVEALDVRREDGEFERRRDFQALNLIWSHYGEPYFGTIPPGIYRHCDLGHIVQRESANPQTGQPATVGTFDFDFVVQPNTGQGQIRPGVYRIHLAAVASNAKLVRRVIELNFSGQWHDDDAAMFQRGVVLRLV